MKYLKKPRLTDTNIYPVIGFIVFDVLSFKFYNKSIRSDVRVIDTKNLGELKLFVYIYIKLICCEYDEETSRSHMLGVFLLFIPIEANYKQNCIL